MSEQSPNEKGLFKVIVYGTALSFGLLGAIIGSMKDFFGGDAAFVFSYRTILGFVVGFVAGWLLWRFIRRRIAKANQETEL